MKHEMLLKALEALESGEYSVARGCLRYGYSFCALGVMLDSTESGEWELCEDTNMYVYSKHISPLTKMGITREDRATIIEMFDRDECSFEDIAKWIRTNKLGESA
jgi:hypothetical protein